MSESPNEKQKNNRGFTIGAFLIFAISLAVYYATLCPTVFVGDSGELISASWSIGIPHSPGYPLYTFIGYFFSHLPIGENPAQCMNFMTALFGALSVVVLFRLMTIIFDDYKLAFFASLAFAFSRVTWSQSVTAEVYSLNNLIVCLAVTYLILASKSGQKVHLYTASFFSGLALTTHQTSLLLLPVAIWLMVKTKQLPLKGSFVIWLKTAIFYVLGLAFYLYLPIAASRNPAMNWGNPSTFSNFISMLLSPAFTQVNDGFFIDHLVYLVQIIFRELNPIGAILAIIGIAVSLARSSNLQARAITLICLTYIVFFLITLRPVYINLYKLDVYYLPVIMLLTILIINGIIYLTESLTRKKSLSKAILTPVITVILIITCGWNLFGNWTFADKSDNRLAEIYGTSLLESCDKDSILLCNFDDLFILFYLQKVMSVRPDVKIVLAHFPVRGEKAFWKKWLYDELVKDTRIKTGQSESLFFKASKVEDIIETFIDENIQTRPVFFSFYNIPPLDFKEMDYRFEPYHLCYRATKAGQNVDVLNENLRFFKAEEEIFNDLFEKHHNVEEDFILVRFSEILLFNAALCNELDDFEKALGFMHYAVLINPLSIENWAFKARIEEQLGDTTAAVNSIEEIIKYEMNFTREINTQIIDWRYEQAKIYHRAGKNLDAAEILNKYYGLDPRRPESIRELAKEIEKKLSGDN